MNYKLSEFIDNVRLFIIFLVFAIGCTNVKQRESEGDISAISEIESLSIVRIEFNIADFKTWLELYMKGQSERQAEGLQTMGIFSDSKIEDKYHVFISGPSFSSLKKYCDSDPFHDSFTIPASGAIAKDPIEVTELEQREFDQKYRLLLSHRILDYLEWKPIFDSDEPTRTEYGLTTVGVGRSQEDPSLVYVMFAFDDEDKATAYVDSDILKNRMEQSGVIGDLKVTKVEPILGLELQ